MADREIDIGHYGYPKFRVGPSCGFQWLGRADGKWNSFNPKDDHELYESYSQKASALGCRLRPSGRWGNPKKETVKKTGPRKKRTVKSHEFKWLPYAIGADAKMKPKFADFSLSRRCNLVRKSKSGRAYRSTAKALEERLGDDWAKRLRFLVKEDDCINKNMTKKKMALYRKVAVARGLAKPLAKIPDALMTKGLLRNTNPLGPKRQRKVKVAKQTANRQAAKRNYLKILKKTKAR